MSNNPTNLPEGQNPPHDEPVLGRMDAEADFPIAPFTFQENANGSHTNGLTHDYAPPPASEVAENPAISDIFEPNEPHAEKFAPAYYRLQIEGSQSLNDDALLDAAVVEHEYDVRRREWWKNRRLLMGGLAILVLILFLIALVMLFANPASAGTFWILVLVALLLFIGAGVYSWLTLPKLASFGRVYRRFIGVPLNRGGVAWNDPTVPPPDFPGLRDNFFALYRDSEDVSQRMTENDDDETIRKKSTLNELTGLIAPLKNAPASPGATPYVPSNRTAVLDDFGLEMVGPQMLPKLAAQTLPVAPQTDQSERLEQLAHEVEDYSAFSQLEDEPEANPAQNDNAPVTIHNQIASKVAQNLNSVAAEINRWEERADRERAFNAGVLAHYQESETVVREGYSRVEDALEDEIRPTLQRLEAESTYYRSQVQRFYTGQREVLEGARDSALAKLERTRHDLTERQDESLDEQRLLQAELKGLNEQRVRLDNSTNSRFDGLKNQLRELTSRSYNLPPTPRFRSDYDEPPAAGESEETLRLLAQLRADTRLATSAVNNALNRYARLRFDPLDELGRLEQNLSAGTKWQATAWLGNLINFRQSGQLLALAGEVGDAVAVYLDSVAEFDRLNHMWCGLEAAVRELGLTSYTNQLAEAQRYLEMLGQALGSLNSSLAMAPHSPEMARPSTFQGLYDLAAGLQRELDELGGLAGSIARTQERLSELEAELAQLGEALTENASETADVKQDAAAKLTEVQRKQSLILAKLDEQKAARVQKIRSHIAQLQLERNEELNHLGEGVATLTEIGDIAEKLLNKHLKQSRRLLEEANALRRGLEETISAIVLEFEGSARNDRSLRRATEIYAPVWYFQFVERPVWAKKTVGYAACYRTVEYRPTASDSMLSYLLLNKSGTFFEVQDDRELALLTQADTMDYPAGAVNVAPTATDWLVSNGWLSRWRPKLFKFK